MRLGKASAAWGWLRLGDDGQPVSTPGDHHEVYGGGLGAEPPHACQIGKPVYRGDALKGGWRVSR